MNRKRTIHAVFYFLEKTSLTEFVNGDKKSVIS